MWKTIAKNIAKQTRFLAKLQNPNDMTSVKFCDAAELFSLVYD